MDQRQQLPAGPADTGHHKSRQANYCSDWLRSISALTSIIAFRHLIHCSLARTICSAGLLKYTGQTHHVASDYVPGKPYQRTPLYSSYFIYQNCENHYLQQVSIMDVDFSFVCFVLIYSLTSFQNVCPQRAHTHILRESCMQWAMLTMRL